MSRAAVRGQGSLLRAPRYGGQAGVRSQLRCVVAIAGLFASIAVAVPEALPVEPTVSTKEAELLAEAAGVGATNAVEAIALLRDVDPGKASAAIDFAIGNFQFQEDQLDAAAKSYQDAIAKLPSFRNARKNLGRVHLLAEDEAQAVAVFQALVADGMSDADVYVLLGHGLTLSGRWVSAESAYRQALLLDADSGDAQTGLARCLVQQARYREARSLLRSMLESSPGNQGFWSLLANVDVALDATDDAIRTLETAQRLGCCNAVMLALLGDLYLNTGRPAEAVGRYDAALAAGWSEPSRLLRAVEGLIMIGEEAGASAILDSLENSAEIRRRPELQQSQLRLTAELAMLQGNRKMAIAIYRQLIERDPLHGEALLRLGQLLVLEGELGAAELAFERAERLEGMQAEALVRRGELAVQRERFDEAVRLLEAAETIESRPHVARYLTQVRRLAER